jgi:hypothetical protein
LLCFSGKRGWLELDGEVGEMLKIMSATVCAGLLGAVMMVQPAEARRLHFWWEQQAQPEFVPYDQVYDEPYVDDRQDADVAEQFNQDQYDRYMREMGHPKRKRVVDNYFNPQVDQPTYKKAPSYKLKKPAPKLAVAKPVVKAPPVAPDKPVQTASLANRMSDKVQSKKVDCTKGASIVSGYGFSGVTSKSCVGDTLTYAATRSGKNFEIQVNAASGELTNVKRL